jgi:hypothetical protein
MGEIMSRAGSESMPLSPAMAEGGHGALFARIE